MYGSVSSKVQLLSATLAAALNATLTVTYALGSLRNSPNSKRSIAPLSSVPLHSVQRIARRRSGRVCYKSSQLRLDDFVDALVLKTHEQTLPLAFPLEFLCTRPLLILIQSSAPLLKVKVRR
jgi:hypothetical protein